MDQQTTPAYENPRHRVLSEINKAHAETVAAESTPVESADAIPFEPAPSVEPPKAKDADPPPVSEKAPEVDGAGSPHTEPEIPETPAQPRNAEGKFAKEPAPPEMVTVKLFGQEIMVPKAEVDDAGGVKNYQLTKAMERQYQEVAKTKAELAADRAQLATLIQQAKQPQQPQTPQPDQDAEALARANTLLYGDDAQKVQAIKELSRPATIPMEQIEQRVMKKMELEGAEKAFVDRCKDILYTEDGKNLRPMVLEAALSRSQRLRAAFAQTGDFPVAPQQFYKDMEAELRRDLGKPAIMAADLSKRVEEKKAIVEPKTAAGRIPAKAEEKPLTVAQIVDATRKARGQKPLYN